MSRLIPDGIERARDGLPESGRPFPERVPRSGEPSAARQQAGLSALIAIARRINHDAGVAETSLDLLPGGARNPAWLRADSPWRAGDVPVIAAGTGAGLAAGAPGLPGGVVDEAASDTGALAMLVRERSRGVIAEVRGHGPVIAAGLRRRKLRKSTFAPVLSVTDRVVIAALSVCWALCLADFWAWWLQPGHQVTLYGSIINTVVLAYLTCFPVFFVAAVNRLRDVRKQVAVPLLKVAFIVTRAPSEPWEVARVTLEAMLDQDFPIPYDVWLADEKPDAEILRWCAGHGVIVSTRNGVAGYHRSTWPRRTKCKEGNLAYFYDHWGYRSYDVVAQLDCDHVPSRAYLSEMIRPFSDPAVGYVSAPSVCDRNAAESWSARGRLYAEAQFHGAFQLGHSAGWSPVCIGSHYAVRTAALRDIGGIGPELAEDFTTTFLLTAAGWQGAFAISAEAHGDGPNTFAAMLVQEFQWSKSLIVVLLSLVPRNLLKLSWPHRIRFAYALLFYILLTASTLGGIFLAPFAAITGKPWMNVNYLSFLLHWLSLAALLTLMAAVLRRRRLLRPVNAPLVSWENWLYMLVRWPYIARGVWAGFMQVVRPATEHIKVTPKGKGGLERLHARIMAPYLAISVLSSASALVGEATNDAVGYVFLCILGAFTYSVVSAVVPLLHAKEMAARVSVSLTAALRQASIFPLILGIASFGPALAAAALWPSYAQHVFHIDWWVFLSHVRAHWSLNPIT
jgi:cellulose synthase/poly-beta-1,6-N-acetylglucosamine synthase-like glycosyltransferase